MDFLALLPTVNPTDLTQTNILFWTLFATAYAILGGGLKYIDDAFDKHIYPKEQAFLIAPFLGILMAYLITYTPESGSILLAILLGVFLTGKIDNQALQAGFISVIATLVFFGVLDIMLLPLIALTITAIIDEIGNDLSDLAHFKNQYLHDFFQNRWTLKLGIAALAILNIFSWGYFAIFFAFDLAYGLIRNHGRKVKPDLRMVGEGFHG